MTKATPIIFDSYVENLIRELIQEGKKSSAETYDGALKRVRQCFGEKGVLLSEVTREWVLKFRKYLIESKLSTNSINTYLSLIRSAYHQAVAIYGLYCSQYPFENVFITVKRKPRERPSIDILNKMQHAEFKNQEYLSFSRDLFLFSYYAGGMSFRDMALVKKKDIYDGQLHFTRSRSGSEQAVLLTKPMKAIIQAYEGNGIYLFPIICWSEKDLYQQYRSGLRKYNIHIQKLAGLLNIKEPLNTPMHFQENKASQKSSSAAVKAESTLLKQHFL
jgi:site-specific recombinase XerD